MNEKRFRVRFEQEDGRGEIVNGKGVELTAREVVDLLNEQQDKITELEKNFDDLVNWASEIANRNVVLDEQIGELQRENKRLRKELGDCEKFRYTVFKRLNDEHIKEHSIK